MTYASQINNLSEHRYFSGLPKIKHEGKFKSFTWISVTIFTVSFFLIVAIRPTLVTIAKLNKEIEDKTKASQELQKKINSIVAAQDSYARVSDSLDLLDEALPEKSEFPKFAYFLEQTATASGVTLRSLNFERIEETLPQKQTPADIGQPLKFSLSASGDYLQLKSFLKDLELSRRILKIEETSFSRNKKGETIELILAVSGQASFRKKSQ